MELLVVIAIVGVLAGLLLPAVQSAREAGRRAQCLSNLRQITLAATNYETAEGKLPGCGMLGISVWRTGDTVWAAVNQEFGNGHGWATFLLPYVEEQSLFDQIDLERPAYDQVGQPLQTSLGVYSCGSDDSLGRFFRFTPGAADDGTQLPTARFAKGNYAAFATPFHTDLQLLYPGPIVFGGMSVKRIVDGLGATMAFSEVRTMPSEDDERGVWSLGWNAASVLGMDMHHDTSATGGYFTRFRASSTFADQAMTPNHRGPNLDTILKCEGSNLVASQLAGMPCRPWSKVASLGGWQSAAPRSNHPGGVNAAYLDGRVEFLTNNVDPVLMSLMIGIQDEYVGTAHVYDDGLVSE